MVYIGAVDVAQREFLLKKYEREQELGYKLAGQRYGTEEEYRRALETQASRTGETQVQVQQRAAAQSSQAIPDESRHGSQVGMSTAKAQPYLTAQGMKTYRTGDAPPPSGIPNPAKSSLSCMVA